MNMMYAEKQNWAAIKQEWWFFGLPAFLFGQVRFGLATCPGQLTFEKISRALFTFVLQVCTHYADDGTSRACQYDGR